MKKNLKRDSEKNKNNVQTKLEGYVREIIIVEESSNINWRRKCRKYILEETDVLETDCDTKK